jgi:trans-aconitate methyltransferase
MPDIDLYTESPELYDRLQRLRPDYVDAVDAASVLAEKYTASGELRVLDMCCGTGATTLKFSRLKPLAKVELVDMNPDFLRLAKSSGIRAHELTVVNEDIRQYRPSKEFDLVFSIFAYHHVPDSDKEAYIKTIESALSPGGVLLLAEIFLRDKAGERAYYRALLETIPENEHTKDLESFLEQTANSTDFEFKVPKTFTDTQFRERGFHLLEEQKIWPKTQDEEGTYVQVYRYGAEKNKTGPR